jgi:phosphoglycolate phosphatase-like HAD superfamily hydrolase
LVDCSRRDYALYCDSMRDIGEAALPFAEFWPLRRHPTNIRDLIMKTAKATDAPDRFLKLRQERCELPEYLKLDQPLPGTYFSLWMMAKFFDVHVVSARFDVTGLENEIIQLGLDRRIKNVVAARTQDKRKAIEHVGPGVIAVIGDAEHDILPAQALGLQTIAVTTGIRSREYLESLKPTWVVDTLIDALGIIQP